MKKLLLILLIPVAAVVCGNPMANASRKTDIITISTTHHAPEFWHGKIDGIECIALYADGAYAENVGYHGVSCNWQPR